MTTELNKHEQARKVVLKIAQEKGKGVGDIELKESGKASKAKVFFHNYYRLSFVVGGEERVMNIPKQRFETQAELESYIRQNWRGVES